MRKKNELKTNPQVGTEEEAKELFKKLSQSGCKLSNELLERLLADSDSDKSLYVATFAMARTWATLKAIAKEKGFEAEEQFVKLLPIFTEEAEAMPKAVAEK